MRKGCHVPGSGYLAYPASCIPGVRVFRRQVPGTEYRIRWPAFGPRPGQRRREGRTSLAPHPSMAEGRIPRTEPGYRLSGTWGLVPGTGAGPTPRAEHRAPKTEPAYWKTRTPGLARAVVGSPNMQKSSRSGVFPRMLERAPPHGQDRAPSSPGDMFNFLNAPAFIQKIERVDSGALL
jgi:hypothetical protein